MAELEREIAGLVDRLTIRIAACLARTLHHAGPPLGLSRDLIIRGLADKLQERAHGGPSRALQRRLQTLAGELEKGALFFRSRYDAEDLRDLGAAVARARPYRPRARGRVRIRGPSLSVADRDCRADHRGTLVGPAVLWPEQASACILVAEAVNEIAATRTGGTEPCAVRSIPANRPRRGSSRSSIRCRRSAKPVRPSSPANGTKAGPACLKAYDDGGFSGATTVRPALQRLLADLAAGRVDTVVVYKIDRLTRSLADFAKIVEILDK